MQKKYAILFASESKNRGFLPDDFITEYYEITETRPLADGYEEKNEGQLNGLLSQQDAKINAWHQSQDAKNKQDAQARDAKAKAKRDAIDAIDLSLFTPEQKAELEKLIDLLT